MVPRKIQPYFRSKQIWFVECNIALSLTEKVEQNSIMLHANDGTLIKIRFIDLSDLRDSLSSIITEIRMGSDE